VGRGLHSAGGEASLPRNVERYLSILGLKYHWRQGALDVKIRRPFSLVPPRSGVAPPAAAAAAAAGAGAKGGV
jgi:hypothetical protein